eukprot:g12313.t1
MTRAANPPRAPPPPPMPTPLDWERIGRPSCCVCRQVYAAEVGDSNGNSNNIVNNNNPHTPSSRRGGPGAGGEESFVVLPDSAPVLSEDYFTLARNHNSNSNSNSLALASSGISAFSPGSSNAQPVDTTPGGLRLAGGGSSLAPGSELLESRYSGYGGSGGFGAGWTGSFGVGSSMLDSIVQISHAGLSDNVRRESLLYDLSKKPSRWSSGGGVDALGQAKATGTGGRNGNGGPSDPSDVDEANGDAEQEKEDEENDPTLCCHCYASLLEQIDEDSRLADREAVAYRDFIELLDGVSSSASEASDSTSHTGRPPPSPADATADTKDQGSAAGLDKTPAGEGRLLSSEGDTRKVKDKENGRNGASASARASACETDNPPRPTPGRAPKGVVVGEDKKDAGDSFSYSSSSSPYAQALRIAEQTSVQLRTELRSLETQRGSLCTRGSEAWAALSELAYARGVLGDECREMLQVSREVAENAARLSERSALSDLFSIRHIDGFPSINGYRLGRAPDDKRRLHWNEINAAWGEAALLVRCVSNAVDFRSRRFRLVPLNCASRVIELASSDNRGGLSQGEDDWQRARGPDPEASSELPSNPSSAAAAASSVVVVCAHDLFSTGSSSSGRSADEKQRHLAAVRAFLACSAEVMAFLERSVLERRLEGEMSAGAACVAWSNHVGDEVPYKQTEDAIGGVSIGALKSRAAWKAWLCQLVKNLEWAVVAASSLCVA